MWRNWQTRRFQVPVGDHMGSSPFIRTNKHPCGCFFVGADEGLTRFHRVRKMLAFSLSEAKAPFIRTKIGDFRRFFARNRPFFRSLIGIIYDLRGRNREEFTIHSTLWLDKWVRL